MRAKTKVLILILFLFALSKIKAQTDTVFWFAAPEISQVATSNSADRPIWLRVSTYSQNTTVVISEPANAGFSKITLNIPANTTYSADLTPFIDVIENKPADKILPYGLQITSDEPVTLYYDVSTLCKCNPEIYNLKGRNALGTRFYIPSQTNFWNATRSAFQSIPPYSSFNIVATENNTKVTINPSHDIVGHLAKKEFSITLNKGESYAAIAKSQAPYNHLDGSFVNSDKPIAITISDDLLAIDPHADLAGDQIVPISVVGTEYIVPKGYADQDYAYVMATEDNTSVYVSGNLQKVINGGETYTISIVNPTYLTSSKPVYVTHLSGYLEELSEALLPPVYCTGSKEINFTRSSDFNFGLFIITRSGNENSFQLNGNSSLISGNKFNAVPGTGGNWVFASIPSIGTNIIPVGSTARITNSSGFFHLGIINGENNYGAEYGYFSNYGTGLNLGDDIYACSDDTVILDAGPNGSKYLWNDNSSKRFLTVTVTGKYYVTVVTSNCTVTDTINVYLNNGSLDLGKDTTICEGDTIKLKANISVGNFTWQDGSTKNYYEATKPGKYYVKVQNPVWNY